MHHARGALALLAVGGRLYAIGGRDRSAQIAPVETYDPAAAQWRELAVMPRRAITSPGTSTARSCASPAAARRTRARRSTASIRPPRRGRCRATLPTATSGAAAAVLDGVTIVAGGEPAAETASGRRRPGQCGAGPGAKCRCSCPATVRPSPSIGAGCSPAAAPPRPVSTPSQRARPWGPRPDDDGERRLAAGHLRAQDDARGTGSTLSKPQLAEIRSTVQHAAGARVRSSRSSCFGMAFVDREVENVDRTLVSVPAGCRDRPAARA